MSQSKTASGVEVVINQIVGFCLSLLAGLYLYRYLNIEITLGENLAVTTVLVTLALFRSYLLRRLFNWWDISGRSLFRKMTDVGIQDRNL